MRPNQAYKLLHSKAKHKQNKDNLQNGRTYLKQCDEQGPNFQNIQTAHKTQNLKTTQSQNGQKT